jgi:hypothetical protein
MSNAYERLLRHMAEKQIGYWSNRDERAVCLDFPGIIGSYRLFAKVESDDELQVWGQLRISVPNGCRKAVAETIERANYLQGAGEFEMNFDANELRFHISESISEGHLSDETIDRLIDATRIALDFCLPVVLSVIYGNEQPEDAIRQTSIGRSE